MWPWVTLKQIQGLGFRKVHKLLSSVDLAWFHMALFIIYVSSEVSLLPFSPAPLSIPQCAQPFLQEAPSGCVLHPRPSKAESSTVPMFPSVAMINLPNCLSTKLGALWGQNLCFIYFHYIPNNFLAYCWHKIDNNKYLHWIKLRFLEKVLCLNE